MGHWAKLCRTCFMSSTREPCSLQLLVVSAGVCFCSLAHTNCWRSCLCRWFCYWFRCNYKLRSIRMLGSTSTSHQSTSFFWLMRFRSELVGHLQNANVCWACVYCDIPSFNSYMHVICAGRLPRPIKVIDMRENLRDPEDWVLSVGREQSFKCDSIWRFCQIQNIPQITSLSIPQIESNPKTPQISEIMRIPQILHIWKSKHVQQIHQNFKFSEFVKFLRSFSFRVLLLRRMEICEATSAHIRWSCRRFSPRALCS